MMTRNVTSRLFVILAAAFIANLAFGALSRAEEPVLKSLFNGKDLTDWKGLTDFWSVEDGAIVGTTTKKKTQGNTFLVWQGDDIADFELKLKVKFDGNNSGVQYRSELLDAEKFVVKGYQADLHPKQDFFGMLYAEKWRGIVAKRGQKIEVGKDGKAKVTGKVGDSTKEFKAKEWNELTIICVGNRLIHKVNGITTVDITDDHPQAPAKGILALQLHAGQPMTVWFKDINLTRLSGKDAKDALKAALGK